MARLKVCIVIPAFNEESTIGEVVNKVLQYGQPIVVDDCSSDDTANIASRAGATVISHKVNLGYESALNSGFKAASNMKCEIVITLDADGQHDPSLIGSFINSISQGSDLVIGIRHKLPRISEYIFSIYSMAKFGIKDPCCGMKAYRIELYKNMGFFDSYNSVGTELSFYSVMNQCKITQIDFHVKGREGMSRYGDSFKANFRILKALFLSVRRFR